MTFTPPDLADLRVNTLNLDTKFSILLERYKVTIPPPSPSSSAAAKKPLTSLEALIASTQHFVLHCETQRTTECESF